jgi:hypothetical protein
MSESVGEGALGLFLTSVELAVGATTGGGGRGEFGPAASNEPFFVPSSSLADRECDLAAGRISGSDGARVSCALSSSYA